jgi:hypothetical protein
MSFQAELVDDESDQASVAFEYVMSGEGRVVIPAPGGMTSASRGSSPSRSRATTSLLPDTPPSGKSSTATLRCASVQQCTLSESDSGHAVGTEREAVA